MSAPARGAQGDATRSTNTPARCSPSGEQRARARLERDCVAYARIRGRFLAVWPVALSIVLLGLLGACTRAQTVQRSLVAPAQLETLDGASPFLKAHLRSGGVYVLSDWRAESGVIIGSGSLLDPNRVAVGTGEFRLPADSVALFETNVVRPSGPNTAVTVMTGVTAAVAGACLLNPKACFGSCPTFYVAGADGTLLLQAEGFSASIAPALEATDVDMLYHAQPLSRDFQVHVTNEALETHVIRHLDVLALPRPAGGRVFATDGGEFVGVTKLAAPTSCRAPEGDCTAALQAVDGRERWSEADSTDLATRETIELEFADAAVAASGVGLVITARQTLLTTFLIYQALAYMGSDAGRWLASLEAGGEQAREHAASMGRVLGRIDVLVLDDGGEWVMAGSAGETGPLASDSWVVRLPRAATPLRVRLRMTRGLWRLDYVALGRSRARSSRSGFARSLR